MLYKLKTKLRFGKYKGKSVKEIIDLEFNEPHNLNFNYYIVWCRAKLKDFSISLGVRKYFDKKYPQRNVTCSRRRSFDEDVSYRHDYEQGDGYNW